mgnify:CR=1 FL=1
MKYAVGQRVKLTKKFGVYDGKKEYSDYSQRGKMATIIAIDEHGYDVDVDDNGVYGGITDEMVEAEQSVQWMCGGLPVLKK